MNSPESPRWLMKHNQHAKGFRSMNRLRANPIIAARDFYYSYVIYEEELKLSPNSTYFSRMWDCFAVPRIRRSNYGASTVMIAQQMCGINSKFTELARPEPRLIYCSHLVLQLDHLPERRLHRGPGVVCLLGLRCHSSRLHDSDVVPHRYKGPTHAHARGRPSTHPN